MHFTQCKSLWRIRERVAKSVCRHSVGPWEVITIADVLEEICKVGTLLDFNNTASCESTILRTWLLWQ